MPFQGTTKDENYRFPVFFPSSYSSGMTDKLNYENRLGCHKLSFPTPIGNLFSDQIDEIAFIIHLISVRNVKVVENMTLQLFNRASNLLQ